MEPEEKFMKIAIEEAKKSVEKELEEFVKILTEEIPSITEIRIFGSYNNDHKNWNPKKSDIDVYIEMSNPRVYFDRDIRHGQIREIQRRLKNGNMFYINEHN